MSQTINRMYDNHESAARAAHELRSNRFDRFTAVHVVTRSGGSDAGTGSADASIDGIAASIMKGHVLKAHAMVFAERIRRGGTLVTVHAPFGTAAAAMNILDSHGPIDSGVPELKDDIVAWDEAAPCSSALHMPVLLDDSATFSKFWNVPPLLKKAATTSSALGIPETVAAKGPYAGSFGLPLISQKATILSSMLGLPVLSKPRAVRR
jgi:hypothetical protein